VEASADSTEAFFKASGIIPTLDAVLPQIPLSLLPYARDVNEGLLQHGSSSST
jgi:hypothetical protein